MNYKHTQIGYLIIVITTLLILYFGFIFIMASFNMLILAVMILIIFILSSFSLLTIMIDENNLQIKFGYGIFKKRYLIRDIISAKVVKNHWYYGWGIRYWVPRRMWVYNVSGFDAVEIEMRNGRIKRIGTDEPQKLESALLEAIK